MLDMINMMQSLISWMQYPSDKLKVFGLKEPAGHLQATLHGTGIHEDANGLESH